MQTSLALLPEHKSIEDRRLRFVLNLIKRGVEVPWPPADALAKQRWDWLDRRPGPRTRGEILFSIRAFQFGLSRA